MKKVLIVVLMLMMAINVKADMGAPEMPKIKFIVNNSNGACLYDLDDNKYIETEDIIKYGEVVTISSQYRYNNELYGYIYEDSDDESNEEEYIGYIKLSDCKLFEDKLEVLEKDYISLKDRYNVYVFNEKGAGLYAGPSTKYKKIIDIPKNGIATYLSQGDSGGNPMWIYVDYNGTQGWLYFIQDDADEEYEGDSYVGHSYLETEKNKELLIDSSAKVYSFPEDKAENVIGTMSKNEEIICKYYYGYRSNWCYGKTNKLEGWIYINSNFAHSANEKLFVTEKSKVFENPSIKAVSTIIPKGEILTVDYYLSEAGCESCPSAWERVKYNNKYYWIFPYDESESSDNYDEYGIAKKDCGHVATYINGHYSEYSEGMKSIEKISIYKEMDKKSDVVATYNDEIINELYHYPIMRVTGKGEYDEEEYETDNWYYIITSNYKGWLLLDEKTVSNIEDEVYKNEEKEQANIGDVVPIIDKPKKEETDKKDSLTHTQIIYLSIGGAIILSLVAFVTIKLINKKKKEDFTNDYQ